MRTLILTALLTSTLTALEPASHIATTPVPRDGGWMKRHESFNEISKQGQAELVFLGDSITQGWEGAGKAAWEKYFAPLKAANFGIGGDRTEHVLWRLDHGNYDGLKPKLTVLMIGTNNTGHVGRAQKENGGTIYQCSAQQTADGIKTIIQKLREKQPQMKILLLAIFPRGETATDPYRVQNEETNTLIKSLADDKHVHFANIGPVFLQPDGTLPKDIMPDLLHLNATGYEKWAATIEAKVKSLLE
jgi:lysophospholipase L1-like esterase